MLHRTALTAIAVLSFVTSPAPPSAEIRFAPAQGLSLRKSFEIRSEQKLDSISMTVAGEQQDQDQEHTTVTTTQLVVVDRYLKVDGEVDGGRVGKLERQFEEFELESLSELSFGSEKHEVRAEATCELTGHTVVFTWDADEEAYRASSDDAKVEAEWLEALEFELDFLALLPAGEVAVGEEWEVDPERLRKLLRIEQNLPLDWTRRFDGEEHEEREDDDEPEEEESLSGDLVARFDGLREVDGLELAVIHLSGEYEAITSSERTQDGEHGTQRTVSETTLSIEIQGECLWNVSGGHFHACALDAEVSWSSSNETTIEFMDQSVTFGHESTTSGTQSYSARFEPAE